MISSSQLKPALVILAISFSLPLFAVPSSAQTQTFTSFDTPTSNWKTAGTVSASRSSSLELSTTPGDEILVKVLNEVESDDYVTSFSHGDIQLDLEVLLPPNSETGILLQGRYELSISDSWGATTPDPSHLGGIAGVKPPMVNVARAPGLWQKLSILFRSPQFDDDGNKTSNASFVRVAVNGVTVQDEVEVEPTRGDEETAVAPLVFRGDGGPLAFRNIRYNLLDAGPVAIQNLTFTHYHGDFGWELPSFGPLNEIDSGPVEAITSALATKDNNFVLKFEGDLDVPASAEYTFEVTYTGQFVLVIDADTVVNIESPVISAVGEVPRKAGSVRLSAGLHSFEFSYARGRWHSAKSAVGLYVAGDRSIRTRLSAAGSDPDDIWAEFKLEPGDRPRLQRGFVEHADGPRVHAISVGYPNGNHYAYDTDTGALIRMWRGKFIDTSTMWFGRGNEQLAAPQGSSIELSGRPTVATAMFSDTNADFRFGNYRLDRDGNPTFTYSVNGWQIQDAISPNENNRFFTRTFVVTSPDQDDGPIPLRLADDENIVEESSGIFNVGDGAYMIELVDGSAEIVESDGVKHLIATVSTSTQPQIIRTNIVW